MSYRNYLICETEADRPTNAEEGMICYCKDVDQVYVWSGVAWVVRPKITVSSSAPTSPQVGDLWVDTA